MCTQLFEYVSMDKWYQLASYLTAGVAVSAYVRK